MATLGNEVTKSWARVGCITLSVQAGVRRGRMRGREGCMGGGASFSRACCLGRRPRNRTEAGGLWFSLFASSVVPGTGTAPSRCSGNAHWPCWPDHFVFPEHQSGASHVILTSLCFALYCSHTCLALNSLDSSIHKLRLTPNVMGSFSRTDLYFSFFPLLYST